jgi:hypothetical protein
VLARLNAVVNRALLIAVLICIASLVTAGTRDDQQSTPQKPPTEDPVSADRIREGLRRPELQLPPIPLPPPTFRVEVIEKLETPLDVVRRELQEEANVRWKPPAKQGLDLLPALVGLVTKVKSIRREHAEAEARRMVQAELAEFCRTHDCSDIEREPISEGVITP